MKNKRTLALTLGLTAGAVVAALASGRNNKKTRVGSSTYSYPGLTRNLDMYGDSEACYI